MTNTTADNIWLKKSVEYLSEEFLDSYTVTPISPIVLENFQNLPPQHMDAAGAMLGAALSAHKKEVVEELLESIRKGYELALSKETIKHVDEDGCEVVINTDYL